ncbi:5-formyltetrahydrofolate cyclo-ligase [Actinomycetospora straminea]|uniref:5-formyltetrahydrofolate cyclo-ligase n=1 Tax=Actinomycetospora straminea TaxID=663607 RepID=UPI0023666228|nr:5-formyltetrahydrofolate cyclo-ligase [Actinomycetospora straminea]MDD7936248.1 5-formyltetrahydrofolate cyclo-ligase [Actinomycetospora straminea]
MARGARRHDADAGGPAAVNEAKAAVRERVWDALRDGKLARFPGAHGRIPNVSGAEAAAERLRGTDVWQRARTLKCNPDAAQWPVRQRALEDGKTVYMAVPRLAEEAPFVLLDPEHLADTPRKASSIKGASRSGRTVAVEDLEPVDLVVTGCVAVDEHGARLGKGGGFSDLEFAVASEAGLVAPDTPVVTTVHEQQIVPVGDIPVTDHDVRLDLVVTADRVVTCTREARHPGRIDWDALTEEKITAIPLLGRLRPTS